MGNYLQNINYELPPYNEWRTNIYTEFRNCRKNKKGHCFYVINSNFGKIFFVDKKNHATQHIGTTLLEQCLNRIDLNDLFSCYKEHRNGNAPNGVYEKTFTFPYNIGYHECVETTDNDKIIYTVRSGRDKKSRIVLNRQPEPINTIFLVLKPCDLTHNLFMIITAYTGSKAPIEPWNHMAGENETNFWKNHALIGDYKDTDDMGENGYWKNKLKINESVIRQIVAETIKMLCENATDEIEYLYHATPSCYIQSIKKYGLGGKIPKTRFWDYKGTPYEKIKQGCFLATDEYVAESYVESSEAFDELSDRYEEQGKELSIVVFRINVKDLNLSLLTKDTNQQTDDDIVQTYFYNGIIPFNKLTRINLY